MDVDPLADTGPPRYIIESDEEEDEYNPLRPTAEEDHDVNVEIIGDLPKGHALVVATGDISKYWSRNADLGEQRGAIYVNKVQVGLVFRPRWTQAIIVASEIMTRLPVWAMFKYADTTLQHLEPTRVVLLDTYSAATYISGEKAALSDAPMRYLSNSPVDDAIKKNAKPFSPPNLLQSTSAAFFSCLETTYNRSPGFAVLVPSSHAAHPAPKVLNSSNVLALSEDRDEWTDEVVNLAQNLTFQLAEQPTPVRWVNAKRGERVSAQRRQDEVGEGGMYI